ncbi:MAG TPA: HAD-IIIC family phosphatase [Kofleriaceae bacterium]|nr:HAD-IIIC family phosphatase [Kofleriaceae bacterium]
MSLLDRRLRWEKRLVETGNRGARRVALISTFVIDPLVPYLGTELEDRGADASVWVGPYDRIAQECLDSASETARQQPHVLVVWPRFEDLWARSPAPLDATEGDYARDLGELGSLAAEAAQRWEATLVFVLPHVPERLPLGVGDLRNPAGVIATATRAREQVAARLRGVTGVWLADADRAVRTVGARRAFDARLETLARIPYSQELYAEVGEQVARIVAAAHHSARKLIVVDGDNTLWGGVIGEVGWEHVELADNTPGEAFRAFQAHLLDLRRAGWLLALCSKNHDDDIVQVFTRSEMRLELSHFATRRVGWEAKSASIISIADELGLGLDAVVFIDDNPHEIAEVSAQLPAVLCIQMPSDPVHWGTTLARSSAFDRAPPTSADLARAGQYAEERQRTQLRERFASTEDYLADLGLCVRVYPPREEHVVRLAQLVAKTNQFNLTCRRRSEAELRALCSSDQHLVLMADARDRFGDYGQIGVVIAEQRGDTARLDTFLVSCRVLGRGVEDAILAAARGALRQRGAPVLVAEIVEGPRNEPARTFFGRLGAAPAREAALHDIACPPHIELEKDA